MLSVLSHTKSRTLASPSSSSAVGSTWPDGTRTQVMTSMRGKPVSLNGHPDGAIIDTIVDDENRLAYRINEGPLFTVQGVSFPPEADLRKFAFVIDPNDLVVLEPGVPK